MKKLLALSLAALLALSLSVTAFAADGIINVVPSDKPVTAHADSVAGFLFDGQGFFENDDNQVEISNKGAGDTVSPGEAIYYPLRKTLAFDSSNTPITNYPAWTSAKWGVTGTPLNPADVKAELNWAVTKSDAVKSVSVSATWDLNKEYVESARVVQKKWLDEANDETGYAYFLAVTIRSSSLTTEEGISGNLTVKKSSGSIAANQYDKTGGTLNENNKDLKFTLKFDLRETVGFAKLKDFVIKDETEMYRHNWRGANDVDEGEQTFEIEKFENATFDVDVTGQSRILLYADAKYNAAVANKYSTANIDFLNGNGASWNKIGSLKIPAEIGSFIYGIDDDNNLFALSNCEYDEYEEAFIIKTRTIGKYAISDKELDITSTSTPGTEEPAPEAPEPEAPGENEGPDEDPNKTIPNTGAKA